MTKTYRQQFTSPTSTVQMSQGQVLKWQQITGPTSTVQMSQGQVLKWQQITGPLATIQMSQGQVPVIKTATNYWPYSYSSNVTGSGTDQLTCPLV